MTVTVAPDGTLLVTMDQECLDAVRLALAADSDRRDAAARAARAAEPGTGDPDAGLTARAVRRAHLLLELACRRPPALVPGVDLGLPVKRDGTADRRYRRSIHPHQLVAGMTQSMKWPSSPVDVTAEE